MCGIVGAVASRNIVPVLIEGLQRLEYRGYDSCGVAVHADGEVQRVRSVSRVAELEAQLAAEPTKSEDGPSPEILALAAKLIREAIFSNGGIAGSQVEGLRALAADLEAAA